MHVPRKTTELLQKEIERFEADSLISFGGGSPIDSCKVAAYGLLPGRELTHIAVPTTLSAAEYTWGGGVTDEATRVKSSVLYDPRVMPRTVINDQVTHVKLLRTIWGPEYGGELEYLRTYVRTLRKKIEDDPAKPKYILTKPWVGHRFHNPFNPDSRSVATDEGTVPF